MIEMMVRVDEAGNDRAAGGVNRLFRLEVSRHGGDDIEDTIAFDEDMMILELLDAPVSIPADDMTVFDEELHEQATVLLAE